MLALLPLAVLAGGAGALLGNRNLSRALPLTGRSLLAVGAGLAAIALVLLLPFVAEGPATIAGAVLAVAVLAGGLLSDLREREVDIVPLFAGALAAAAGPLIDSGDVIGMTGALVGLLLSTGVYAFGRLYARARGLGLDPETGERLDPLGAGDIALLTLLGALAAPVAGAVAAVPILLAGFILHVAGTVVLLLIRRLRGQSASLGDPVELAPFLVVATLVVLHG